MGRPLWRHDAVVLTLGIASVALVFWFESAGLNPAQTRTVLVIDALLVLYFLVEFVAMWREREWSRTWFVWNAWRLLGMIPLALADLAFLRLLRLARVIVVLDHVPPVRMGMDKIRRNLDWSTLRPLAIAAGFVTLVGALLVWLAERRMNPNLAEFSEALWWAIVTVTTVGYGDITPITPLGRTVAVALMVTGIGTIGMLASQISGAIVKEKQTEKERNVATALERLSSLHESGHLSDDEFAEAKARVLE